MMAGLFACLSTAALSGCGGSDPDTPTPTTAAQAAGDLVRTNQYPGALAVRVTSASIEVNVAGIARIGGEAVSASGRFPIGSLSKSMTATLAGILVQEGGLRWDTRLLDVLPELRVIAQTDYSGVTLRDLLAHRSGVIALTHAEQIAQVPPLVGSPREQRLQFTAWALTLTPATKPGAQVEYSNGGYLAAAAMLERAAGDAYESLVQARLFAPLGIAATFGAAGAQDGEPWGHITTDGKHWTPLDPTDAAALLPAAANPAGGVKMNGAELGRYLQLHLRALRGEPGLLIDPATARVLHTVVQDSFALGWAARFDSHGNSLSWHEGSDDTSYLAEMAVIPATDTAGLVVINAFGPATFADANRALLSLLP